MRDFQKELSDIFKRSWDDTPKRKPKTVVGKELEQALAKAIKSAIPVWYNIHKRSLPVGLDKPVAWNFTKLQGIEFINTRLKATEYIDENTGKPVVIYYDLVRQDGYKSGIYDNDRPIIREDKDNV